MSVLVEGFDALKARLDEIVDEVSSEDISLDDALALYEEAVNIGIAACDASELDIPEEEADEDLAEGVEGAEVVVEAGASEEADLVDEGIQVTGIEADDDEASREMPEQEGSSF